LKVTAFRVDHGAVEPAFGYRIDYGPRSVVISGDTKFSPKLVEFASGADVLIHHVWVVRRELF
jgi:ribonuclease Z